MSDRVPTKPRPLAAPDASPKLTVRERELAAIYERMPGIVFYVRIEADGEFRFLMMSPAGLEATGLTPNQLVGARVRDENTIPGMRS